ncbi:helix-turn-helix domain-containing protein [Gallibacterium salpingitidis]|uniref:helix-turn-helix domain-containing protein n=1 Tax=Gallibacterium salpingitidis TaxID=505341 RepID=UPI00266FD74A|nr:helix-turn-helix domain-containing protein [Gallibacterium salpingitidis]WKT00504.1 helix-turn-helix domain-containing protein [Gallibacterium salpingitidis]
MKNINLNEKQSQSQNRAILAYLQKGNSVTPLEALNKFRCLRLSARILDLKNQGYQIGDEMVKDAVTGKRYKRYWLIGE